MPSGKGYFLGPDGEVIPVYEHLMAVEENPGRFRLRPEDVTAQNEDERRNRGVRRVRVLTMVLKNGFCRVRFDGRRNVAEFYAETPEEADKRQDIYSKFLWEQGVKDCVVKNVYAATQQKHEGGQQA